MVDGDKLAVIDERKVPRQIHLRWPIEPYNQGGFDDDPKGKVSSCLDRAEAVISEQLCARNR